MQLTQKWK